MTERPNGSFSRGNVYNHETKWYYGNNKDFGISSLAQAFISCLTLLLPNLSESICFLILKMHVTILPDRTIARNKQHHSIVLAKSLGFSKCRLLLLHIYFTLHYGICLTTSRDQSIFGSPPAHRCVLSNSRHMISMGAGYYYSFKNHSKHFIINVSRTATA